MGSKIYAGFIDLLQRWPVDKSRAGKDLGQLLRKFVAQEFPQGPISRVDETKLGAALESYNRISNNVYRDRYPRRFTESTVFGHPLELYKAATSNEGIEALNKETELKLKREFVDEESK